MNISSLVSLARASSYNEETKQIWKKRSMSFLRRIAKELNLTKGDYSIRFNPGGIAVSGDATLHHNSFYLHINDFGGFWRTCEGQKDYTGGSNRTFTRDGWWGQCLTESELIKQIKDTVFPCGFTHGMQGGGDAAPWSPGTAFNHLPDAYPEKKEIDYSKVRPCCVLDD
jgi:hypothetical protein